MDTLPNEVISIVSRFTASDDDAMSLGLSSKRMLAIWNSRVGEFLQRYKGYDNIDIENYGRALMIQDDIAPMLTATELADWLGKEGVIVGWWNSMAIHERAFRLLVIAVESTNSPVLEPMRRQYQVGYVAPLFSDERIPQTSCGWALLEKRRYVGHRLHPCLYCEPVRTLIVEPRPTWTTLVFPCVEARCGNPRRHIRVPPSNQYLCIEQPSPCKTPLDAVVQCNYLCYGVHLIKLTPSQ